MSYGMQGSLSRGGYQGQQDMGKQQVTCSYFYSCSYFYPSKYSYCCC